AERFPDVRDHRFQAVVSAGRSSRPRPQLAERQLRLVDHHQDVAEVDLEIANELADRLAAQIHERERLAQENGLGRQIAADPGDQRVGRRGLELNLRAAGQLVDDLEPDVVPGAAIPRTRIAQPEDRFQCPPRGYFFFSSFASFPSSSSFLPFLMTSGSAGVAVAAAASAGAGASSARGMMTCTSIASPSVSGVHLGSIGTSRTRMPWCSISSLMSISTCSGMSPGRHSISISRRMNSSTPPCCFTPFGSPRTVTGIVTCSTLSMATR